MHTPDWDKTIALALNALFAPIMLAGFAAVSIVGGVITVALGRWGKAGRAPVIAAAVVLALSIAAGLSLVVGTPGALREPLIVVPALLMPVFSGGWLAVSVWAQRRSKA